MDKSLLHVAIKSLVIQDVYFEKASAEIVANFDQDSNEDSVAVQFRSRVVETRRLDTADGKEGMVRIVAECGMRLIATPEAEADERSNEEKALISATLVAEYQLVDELSADALKEFADNNGLFHVWPFWREYVHSTCARLRIPVVPVPMYTLPNIPRPPAPSENVATDETPKPTKRKRAKKQE